jgi:hypothetical protein
MKKVRVLALGTTLVLALALAAQAKNETTGAMGDASCYQIGQPTATDDGSCYYQIGQLPSTSYQAEAAVTDQQAAGNSEEQTTAAFRTRLSEPITLDPKDWTIPQSYYETSSSGPVVYAGR